MDIKIVKKTSQNNKEQETLSDSKKDIVISNVKLPSKSRKFKIKKEGLFYSGKKLFLGLLSFLSNKSGQFRQNISNIKKSSLWKKNEPAKRNTSKIGYNSKEKVGNTSKISNNNLFYRFFSNIFVKVLIFTICIAATAYYSFMAGKTISDTQNWKRKYEDSENRNITLKTQVASLEAVNIKNEGMIKKFERSSSASSSSLQNYNMSLSGVFSISAFPSFSIELGDKWSVEVLDESNNIVPQTSPNNNVSSSSAGLDQSIKTRKLTFTNQSGSVIKIDLEKTPPPITGVKCWEEKQALDLGSNWFRVYEGGEERFYVTEEKAGTGYGLTVPANNQECKNQKKTYAQGFLFSRMTGGGVASVKAIYKSEADKTLVDNIVKTIKL